MKTQTPDQGQGQTGGGVSRQSTRLSISDTPLDCSTRQRKRSSVNANVSNRETDDTIEPVDLGPTLEDRRQEVIMRYFSEVKERALALLAARQAGLKKVDDAETEGNLPLATPMEGDRLSTIEERGDDDQLSKQGTTTSKGDSQTKASDVREELDGGVEGDETGQGLIEQQQEDESAEREQKDVDVEAMEKEAVDGIIEQSSDESQEPPELSQDLVQALHEAVWVGDIDLLDDMLDLPGANMDLLWFGENLLMTAIRAGQAESASFLIENGVKVQHEVPRFERKDDLQAEIDAQKAAFEQEQLELKAKKKKTKKKDKEKEMLEQLEKEKDEEVKTPEPKASNTLTDLDCYLVNCRMMAVEFDRDEITEFIDEAKGEMWSKELVPRKPRQKRKKQELMEKIKQREDWILSEEEIVEPEEEPEAKPKEKVKKKKALSRHNTETERPSKLGHRTRLSTMQSERDVTLNISGEKPVNGGLPECLTVAGEDTTLFVTPTPQNTPVPAIHHSAELRSPETKFGYRGTRSFLIRKSANIKYKDLSLEIPRRMPKKDTVKTHGSFLAESDSWSPSKFNPSNSSQKQTLKSQQKLALHSRSGSDFYNDLQRFERLRSKTRKVSPWEEDNPETLLNMLKRSKTQPHLPRAEVEISKAKLSKENTFALGDQKFGGSLSNSSLRSVSSFALHDKGAELMKAETSKNTLDRRNARSSSSHVLKRYKSEMIKPSDRPPQTFPSKLQQKNPLTQSMKNIHSPKPHHYNNFSNVRENAWLEKNSPVNLVQKYYKAKRYSPAGYLKGGHHSKDDMENYNQLSLYEQRKDKSLAVLDALVVA